MNVDACGLLQPLQPQSESARRWLEQQQRSDSSSNDQVRARRKSTYVSRKEEAKSLRTEVGELTQQIDSLKRVRENGRDAVDLALAFNVNKCMRSLVDTYRERLGDAYSELSIWLNEDHSSNTISSYIHLTRDPQKRRDTLMAMKEPMLAKADKFLRIKNVKRSLLKPYAASSQYETLGGDLCCVNTEIAQLTDAMSARQAYDALMFTISHMEISAAEHLGEIMVRDDYHALKDGVANYHFSTWNHPIAPQEANCALFTQFYETDDEEEGYGLTVVDFVDQDDLHPYRSNDTLRRDMTIACKISSHRDPANHHQPVIVIQRSAYVKIHSTPLVTDSSELNALRKDLTKYFDVWYTSIRDNVAAAQNCLVSLLNDNKS